MDIGPGSPLAPQQAASSGTRRRAGAAHRAPCRNDDGPTVRRAGRSPETSRKTGESGCLGRSSAARRVVLRTLGSLVVDPSRESRITRDLPHMHERLGAGPRGSVREGCKVRRAFRRETGRAAA